MTDHDSKATDMAGDSAILRELGKINNELGQIKEGQNVLQTKVGKIETRLNFHFIGLILLLGIMVWLHTDQNARINRVEARLETKIDGVEERIVSRLETVFANQPTTACQCEKEN